MKKEITLGQLLSVAVTLLIAIVTGWVTLNSKVSAHDIEIKSLNEKETTNQAVNERNNVKLDRIMETQTQILIKLENKKNRE